MPKSDSNTPSTDKLQQLRELVYTGLGHERIVIAVAEVLEEAAYPLTVGWNVIQQSLSSASGLVMASSLEVVQPLGPLERRGCVQYFVKLMNCYSTESGQILG